MLTLVPLKLLIFENVSNLSDDVEFDGGTGPLESPLTLASETLEGGVGAYFLPSLCSEDFGSFSEDFGRPLLSKMPLDLEGSSEIFFRGVLKKRFKKVFFLRPVGGGGVSLESARELRWVFP